MSSYMRAVSLPQTKSCHLFFHSGHIRRRYAAATISRSYNSSSIGSQASKGCSISSPLSRQNRSSHPLTITAALSSVGGQLFFGLSSRYRSLSLRLSMPACENVSRVSWNARHTSWILGGASVGVCLSFSTSSPVYAEAPMGNNNKSDESSSSSIASSHGKKVYTDYSITGIPGDGRCLFRSVVHGACLRSGKPSPDKTLQRGLADELRAQVADEFIKRRAETEWFVEGDFDTYVSQIRNPHVWGGEPELLMASHVLQMPITVYMHDEHAGGLIAIAEYGQEYGKEDPIRVLYDGFGHYDALQIHGKKGAKSRYSAWKRWLAVRRQ